MTHNPAQSTLFDSPVSTEAVSPGRQKQIKKAFARADAKWREAYAEFIVTWLRDNGPAIAETIRLEYESRRDLPQLLSADKRASGYLFTEMVKQGLIKRTGEYGWSVERSSPMPYYRAK